MITVARLFKLLFKLKFTRKYYFGLYKRLFRPTNLFGGIATICRYGDHQRMKVDLDEWIQQNVFLFGIYDAAGIGFIRSFLKKGDAFLDIGANVGCYTLAASDIIGEKGRVIAFEAVKKVADRLEENVRLNNLANITIVRKAVYEKETLLNFHVAAQQNLGMSSILHHDTESGITEEVPAIDLDHFLPGYELPAIQLVKMDIEGAEIFALRGMRETLLKYKPHVLIEVSPQVLPEASERQKIFDFFDDLGYKSTVLSRNTTLTDIPEGERDRYTNFVFMPV
ncbi:MAG TPA: FkbM family methyltransferase [Bacteroidales bacterium]|nr:FkbM family methyltransferase [Bacteroidales bacterium]